MWSRTVRAPDFDLVCRFLRDVRRLEWPRLAAIGHHKPILSVS